MVVSDSGVDCGDCTVRRLVGLNVGGADAVLPAAVLMLVLLVVAGLLLLGPAGHGVGVSGEADSAAADGMGEWVPRRELWRSGVAGGLVSVGCGIGGAEG